MLAVTLCIAAALTPADVVLQDLAGHSVHPLAKRGRPATVYIFALSECPIANAYAPEIRRIADRYGKNAQISLVLVDPSLTAAKAREYAKEFGYTLPVLLDPLQQLGKPIGISTSPEAAVFDKGMHLVYRGRIDDQFFGLGKRRSVVTSHDLRRTLDAILAGKPVKASRTPAVGCILPEPKK